MTTKFYTFIQNNSGGAFILNDYEGIGPYVVIEARDAHHANERAEEIGLYFDGVDEEQDCPCCGDRWYAEYHDDAGTAVPTFYGKDLQMHGEGEAAYVHPLEGKFYRMYVPL